MDRPLLLTLSRSALAFVFFAACGGTSSDSHVAADASTASDAVRCNITWSGAVVAMQQCVSLSDSSYVASTNTADVALNFTRPAGAFDVATLNVAIYFSGRPTPGAVIRSTDVGAQGSVSVEQSAMQESPGLEAKTLFEMLQESRPDAYGEGQLRTLQRRVKQWRATKGPDKEVFFSQAHRAGEAAQTDFTHGTELGVTIMGVLLVHLLCHFVLPYSNWESVTVCMSESLLSLRRGVQAALFRLGRYPVWHQTDNSTAATHTVGEKGRKFNEEYASMMTHFGMKPRTTEVGAKEQNGDVEAANRALKRRIGQRLLVRKSSDFESVEAYELWLTEDPVARANAGRRERLEQELAVMAAVRAERLPEFREQQVNVSSWSTIRIANSAYSVPSRLIGESVCVRIFERTLEVYYAQKKQLVIERVSARNGHCVNYRHVIWSLVQKPGAFARYRYREDLFPTLVFRRAYDAITGVAPTTAKDLAYLRILLLAAATSEVDVEAALSIVLDARQVPDVELIKDIVGVPKMPSHVPAMAEPTIDLSSYDALLTARVMS